MDREVVYIGRDNDIRVLLRQAGVLLTTAQMDTITKMELHAGGDFVVSLNETTHPIQWRKVGYQPSEVRFFLRDVTWPLGALDGTLIVFPTDYPNGIVWGHIPLELYPEHPPAINGFSWIASGAVAAPVVSDCSGALGPISGTTFTYQQRDGITVMRPSATTVSLLSWSGALVPRPAFGTGKDDIEVRALMYHTNPNNCGPAVLSVWGFSAIRGILMSTYTRLSGAFYSPSFSTFAQDTTVTAAGWWWIKIRVEWVVGGSVNLKLKRWQPPADEPATWLISGVKSGSYNALGPWLPGFYFGYTGGGACDLAELHWELS